MSRLGIGWRDVVALLPIDKHRLDDEFVAHAEVQHRIHVMVNEVAADLEHAKQDLDGEESRLFMSGKEKGAGSLEYIRSAVKVDAVRKKKLGAWMEAKEAYERWDGMLDAWKQRGFSLSKLADLAASGYYAVDAAYRENREAMRKEREKRAGFGPVRGRREV